MTTKRWNSYVACTREATISSKNSNFPSNKHSRTFSISPENFLESDALARAKFKYLPVYVFISVFVAVFIYCGYEHESQNEFYQIGSILSDRNSSALLGYFSCVFHKMYAHVLFCLSNNFI